VKVLGFVQMLRYRGRNEEFLDVAIEYAQGVVVSAEVLRLFPTFLKP
jgi:hypothetical protein